MTLQCVKPIFLDIWRVQQYVCSWFLWLSKLTISFRVVSSHVLFCIYMLQSTSLMPLVGASCFPKLVSNEDPLALYLWKFDRIL